MRHFGLLCFRALSLLATCGVALTGCQRETPVGAGTGGEAPVTLTALRATSAVESDPDDPAIWVHPTDPAQSLILGTDKIESTGSLYVFGLDGRVRQRIEGLDRPNNVDLQYDVRLGGVSRDVAVVTERKQRRLRVFTVDPDARQLVDVAPRGLPVLGDSAGEAGEPMGLAIYRRPRDGAVFVIVAPKTGGSTDYLWQYRLVDGVAGSPALRFVRRFGRFSQRGPVPDEIGEIEAVVVDDELGYVYYSDERFGIRKYHADPDAPGASEELAAFGIDGYLGDREGLAIYATGPGMGYVVSSDQVEGGTRIVLYRREGEPGAPHVHRPVATIPTPSDATDGLEVTASPLPALPRGLLVMMNSSAKNFLLYDWRQVEAVLNRTGPTK